MLERLLPSPVSIAEAFADEPDEPVFPGEEDLVADAVAGRRAEFVTARGCARTALAELGYLPAPIRRGPGRGPCWPVGAVGSITHCDGYRASAVARRTDFAAVGVDAEPHRPLTEMAHRRTAAPDEAAQVNRLADLLPSTCWDRLLFSAKESIFKAWCSLTGQRLGFSDMRVSLDAEGAFRSRLLVSPEAVLAGQFLIANGLILTAVTVPAVAGPRTAWRLSAGFAVVNEVCELYEDPLAADEYAADVTRCTRTEACTTAD